MEFAVLDIETRVDKPLLNRVFFADSALSDDEAFERFRQELGRRGSDFFPLTLHVPISIAIGEVSGDYVLRRVDSLGPPRESEQSLVNDIWARLERFEGCLVTFNGRRFDLPVLELAAMRWGVSAPHYFEGNDSLRRHRPERHLDLCEYLTNYGEVYLRGGLDLLVKMLGLPGKPTMRGARVQECFESGRFEEIHRYCRTDVIQTYFLFLRVQLMRGQLDRATYEAAYLASFPFLEELGTEQDKVDPTK